MHGICGEYLRSVTPQCRSFIENNTFTEGESGAADFTLMSQNGVTVSWRRTGMKGSCIFYTSEVDTGPKVLTAGE